MEIQAINVRNQFTGQVKEIIRGDVLSEVDVQTPWGIVTSVITTRSVDDLQLTTGSNVVALVKSTEVSIATLSVHVAPKTHAAPAFPRRKNRSLAIDEAFGSSTVADSAHSRRPLWGDPAPTPRSPEFLPAFYRLRNVMRICALSRTTIYHRIAEGRFPPPVTSVAVHQVGRAPNCNGGSKILRAIALLHRGRNPTSFELLGLPIVPWPRHPFRIRRSSRGEDQGAWSKSVAAWGSIEPPPSRRNRTVDNSLRRHCRIQPDIEMSRMTDFLE